MYVYIYIYTVISVETLSFYSDTIHHECDMKTSFSTVSEAANKGLLEQIRTLFCSQQGAVFL